MTTLPPQLRVGTDEGKLVGHLILVGAKGAADVVQAARSAVVERTIDGASTLTVVVADHQRRLLRSGVIDDRLWAEVDGLRYALVNVSKGGDSLTLLFEDSVVDALRRRKGTRKWEAGSTSRTAIVRDMAREVPVPVEVDPSITGTVSAEVNRSKEGQDPTDSWSVSGSLATDVQARRFSTGTALVFGGDAWLMTRYPVVRLTEPVKGQGGQTGGQVNGNPVVAIDFTIDYAQDSNSATLTVDADRWAVPPGQGVELSGMGPADGRWLVQRSTKTLTRTRMSVDLQRAAKVLAEPKEDAGDFDFLPGYGASAAGTAPTNTLPSGQTVRAAEGTARQVMVNAAKSQSGAPYTWGGNGPKATGYDCSGLVQYATRVAGKVLVKTARNQYNTLKAAGKLISIEDALKTEGAILLRIDKGETDHVAISLGNGQTVEARGKAYGCGVFPGAAGRDWTHAGVWL